MAAETLVSTLTGGTNGKLQILQGAAASLGVRIVDTFDGATLLMLPDTTSATTLGNALLAAGNANQTTVYTGSTLEVISHPRGAVVRRQDSKVVLDRYTSTTEALNAAIAQAKFREAQGIVS